MSCGLLGGLLLLAATLLAQSPEDQLESAVKLQQSGDLKGAIRGYEAYLKTHPNRVEALSNLGAAYAHQGRYGDAIEQYARALRIAENPAVRFNLALAYYDSGQLSKAVPEFARVLGAQPNNRRAALLLGDCRLRTGENKQVIEILSPLQAADPDDPALLYVLGTALIRENRLVEGQTMIDRILRKGDSAEAHLMLGTASMAGHDYKKAAEEFGRAIELNPKLPLGHSLYGRALLATGDRPHAAEAFHAELAIDSNDYDSNLYLGVLLKQDQNFVEALNYFKRALEIRPGSPDARYQVGSMYVSTGNLPEAQQILESLIKESPDFVEAHVSLATVYYRLKRKPGGDREQEIVRKLNAEIQARAPAGGPERAEVYEGVSDAAVPGKSGNGPARAPLSPEPPGSPVGPPAPAARIEPRQNTSSTETSSFKTLSQRADAARQADQTDEAIDLYRRAVNLKADWSEGWWYIGTLEYQSNRYAEARPAFEKLTALKPKGGPAFAMLGLCEFELQNYGQAFEHLQQSRILGLESDSHLSVVSRYHLALLLNRFGDSPSAVQLLWPLARQDNDTEAVIQALGMSALEMHILPSDLPSSKRSIVTDVGWAEYYLAHRNAEEASVRFGQVLATYPSEPGVHYAQGVFLLASDANQALGEFKKELEISPQHLNARLQIAFEYIKRNDYSPGLTYAEQAVKLEPQSFAARNALGRILLELGETERAIQELETGMKLEPESPETLYALARAYARAGRKQDADRARAEFNRLDKMRRSLNEGGAPVPEGDPKKSPPG